MADRIGASGANTHITSNLQSQIEARRVGREAALEGSSPSAMESVTPEHAAELETYYNTALQNIDLLRHPIDFPDITPPFDIPDQQTAQGESGGEGSGIGEEQGGSAAPGQAGGSDPAFYGKPPERMFYTGSPEELQLKEKLESAKQSGNRTEIKKAKANLDTYWRNVIDQEYRHIGKSEMPGKLKSLRTAVRQRPNDPFVQYRIHSLTLKAKELCDFQAQKELGQLKNGGVLKKSSPTGNAIADYANNHVGGNGHQCYAYVANALDTVGINLWGESAYMAARQLGENPKVREIKGVRADQLESLPKGAIVVWNKGNGHEDGHISISRGDGKEVSDIVRDQLTDYGTSFRVFVPTDMIDG